MSLPNRAERGQDEAAPAGARDAFGDEALGDALVAALDAEEASIDASVTARLLAARRQARIEARSPRRRLASPLLPAALTAALLFLLVLPLGLDRLAPEAVRAPDRAIPVAGDPDANPFEALPVLAASDDIEFYRSVDFLIWLERQRG